MAESKSKNSALHHAKEAKADEFYTQLVDIEKELMHYTKEFEGKVVFCNCDDPYQLPTGHSPGVCDCPPVLAA